MGVIRKSDPKLGLYTSESEESLHIPQYSEDDDDSNSNSVGDIPLSVEISGQNRHRQRLRAMPMSFISPRKRIGKKRIRRYENGHHLETLLEDEEFTEVTIYDFIPNNSAGFSILMESQGSLQLWEKFINSTEEVQQQIANMHRQNQSKTELFQQRNFPQTGGEAFQNIKSGLRSKLKKSSLPLGMIEHLENQVVEFFSSRPAQIFVSGFLTSFERLLLHAVAQYHNLVSLSFDSGADKLRLVRISNPFETFEEPTERLVIFLTEKRKQSFLH